MNVNLHIERLVLDGVEIAPGRQRVLQAAVEAELTRLLTEGGVDAAIAAGGATPRLAGNPIQLQLVNTTWELGKRIASAVYGGIGK